MYRVASGSTLEYQGMDPPILVIVMAALVRADSSTHHARSNGSLIQTLEDLIPLSSFCTRSDK